MRQRFQDSAAFIRRFGFPAYLAEACFRVLSRLFYFECLQIIVLRRDSVQPAKENVGIRLTGRVAEIAEVEALASNPDWGIGETKLGLLRAGDSCFFSFVNGELGGYSWVHTGGAPQLLPGLKLSIPEMYLYNFAALTLPQYRGVGMQSFRHLAILSEPQWAGKLGLLGFVNFRNWASRKGQAKSGYRKIGSLLVLGSRRRFLVLLSPKLRSFGVRRIQ
ncbi:MAG: hypothetical protein IT482_02110 [Gammaproteobacteria bacterium]|nr:hypothetical protein [Gammaproteobacteria bacterium]